MDETERVNSGRDTKRVAIIGGTGQLGAAIAGRLAGAGWSVILGSRSPESAAARARELGGGVSGVSNRDAAAGARIVILTVPYAAHEATLLDILPVLDGRILVDTTVPLAPPRVARVQLPPEGSAAERTRLLVGERARIVSAFHNVAAHKLARPGAIDCDVLVFGDDPGARGIVIELAAAMGLRGLHGGSLANSAAAEALTSILIFLNKAYEADGAGIRITGVDRDRTRDAAVNG
jgi:NADPH-dependent F420 reductase